MNTTAVVVVLLLIVAGGVYIGVSGLSQYSVDTSGSNAGQIACAPDVQSAALSQRIKFTASIPEGTSYYWSAPDGTSSFIISGPLTVQYARTGTKTVSLFYPSGKAWLRITCSVVIK